MSSHDFAGPNGEFHFPRPSDSEIDALFEDVKATRDLGPLNDKLSPDQKWLIVVSDEQARWIEDKKRAESEAARNRSIMMGQTPAASTYSKDSPEWYLKKFMDKTITHKHVASLCVSLRTMPVACATPTLLLNLWRPV